METKNYLNEKVYQKNKKKITIIAVFLLIVGLCVGGGLIATGLIKYKQTKLSVEQINEIQTEINNYNTQLSSLKAQKHQEFKNNTFSENYYKLDNEIEMLEDKIDDLEDKLDPDTSYLFVFYMFGAFIVIATFMISGSIYATAKGREINAFYVQQQMPVVKEGIDEMAPTVGNAVKEMTKGIKEGINDQENK